MINSPRMDMQNIKSSKFLTITCIVLCLSSISICISSGPTDKTRKAGEDDVIFICPTIDELAPIWTVNGLNYGSSSLPPPFEAAFDNLLIPFVDLSMDQFTFRCFIRDSNGLGVTSSSTGTLTVTRDVDSSNARLNVSNHNCEQIMQTINIGSESNMSELILHHRFVEFNEGITRTISWHYSDGHNDSSCNVSNVFIRIRGWQCHNANQINSNPSWERHIQTGITEATIDSNNLSSTIITLEAINNANRSCVSLKYGIQINETAQTETTKVAIGDDVCVSVPADAGHGIWPMIPTNKSASNDCECPLCTEYDCLQDCHCINQTSYMVTLQTVESESSTINSLCIHNITDEMNGIYIHFYSDKFTKCIENGIYREYFDSYQISVELPARPSITYSVDENICFSSVSPAESPIQFFEILIYDIAGERQYYKRIHSERSDCILIPGILRNSLCSPFRVDLSAFNKNGNSTSSVQIVENGTDITRSFIDRKICECINSTVQIDSSYDVKKESVEIQISCNRNYSSYLMPLQNRSELAVNITLYSGSINPVNRQGMHNISCSEQKMIVSFGNLTKTLNYTYAIERRVESSNDTCILQTKVVIIQAQKGSTRIGLIVGLVLPALVLGIAITIVVVVVLIKYLKKHAKSKCEPKSLVENYRSTEIN